MKDEYEYCIIAIMEQQNNEDTILKLDEQELSRSFLTESLTVKEVALLFLGFLIGGGLIAGYFLFLGQIQDPIALEKTVSETKVAPTVTSTILTIEKTEAKPADFRTIHTYSYDNNGMTIKNVLSSEDAAIVETIGSVLRNDTMVPSNMEYFTDINNTNYPDGGSGIIVSSGYAFISIGVPKGGGGEDDIVVDLQNKKVTDVFRGHRRFMLDQNAIIVGNSDGGFIYYKYGTPSSVKIQNSSLTGNETYTAWDGPEGSTDLQMSATTTTSFTFSVFDKTTGTVAPGDDTAHYKKVGERTFLIP